MSRTGPPGDALEDQASETAAAAGGGSAADWAALQGGGVAHGEDFEDQTTLTSTSLTDYRRRCQLLEASLVKFKDKATRVRQLFTIKVCTL